MILIELLEAALVVLVLILQEARIRQERRSANKWRAVALTQGKLLVATTRALEETTELLQELHPPQGNA